ncbi:MAG: hypothetical protein KDD44_13130, partial [Bdellovibrionales bacterium]|nr:hypothetical protein [Bdellovibrionales bacterium]
MTNILREQCLSAERAQDGSRDWISRIEADNWSAALSEIETELSVRAGDIPLRLWWVVCQLEVGGLPLTALSATVDDLTSDAALDELGDAAHARSLAAYVCHELARRLEDRSQLRLATVMSERAWKLLSSDATPGAESLAVARETYLRQLRAELERGEGRLEKPRYLESLREQIDQVEASGRRSSREGEIAPPAASRPRTAKDILQQAVAESAASSAAESDALELEEAVVAPSPADGTGRESRRLLGALSVVGGLVLLALWLMRPGAGSHSAHRELAMGAVV